jgi:hypothetical protein
MAVGLLFTGSASWAFPANRFVTQAGVPGIFSWINFSAPYVGTRRLPHLLSDFMRLNVPLSTIPNIQPPPQPFLGGTVIFDENTPVGNFLTNARQGASEVLAFQWNRAAAHHVLFNPGSYYPAVGNAWDRAVFTPGRCFNLELENIPWLRYNTVTLKARFAHNPGSGVCDA